MKPLFLIAVAACAALTAALPARAQDSMDGAGTGDSLLSFSIGYYDVFHDDNAIDLRFEYRPYRPLLINALRPWVGAEVTSDFSTWAGGGLLYDWNVDGNFYLTPSFGAGLYGQGGSDKDLGHIIEFRTQLEGSYQFETNQRLALSLSHMSNLGLDDHNPGAESLDLSWQVPF